MDSENKFQFRGISLSVPLSFCPGKCHFVPPIKRGRERPRGKAAEEVELETDDEGNNPMDGRTSKFFAERRDFSIDRTSRALYQSVSISQSMSIREKVCLSVPGQKGWDITSRYLKRVAANVNCRGPNRWRNRVSKGQC